MHDTMAKIEAADRDQIEFLLQAVLQRYAVLFPEWEISTFSIDRRENRNDQIDRMIRFLQVLRSADP